jgi:hypothetical protein
VGQLAGREPLRDDPITSPPPASTCVGEDAHHPDRAPAIHETEAPRHQLGPEATRRFGVGRPRSLRSAAETQIRFQ